MSCPSTVPVTITIVYVTGVQPRHNALAVIEETGAVVTLSFNKPIENGPLANHFFHQGRGEGEGGVRGRKAWKGGFENKNKCVAKCEVVIGQFDKSRRLFTECELIKVLYVMNSGNTESCTRRNYSSDSPSSWTSSNKSGQSGRSPSPIILPDAALSLVAPPATRTLYSSRMTHSRKVNSTSRLGGDVEGLSTEGADLPSDQPLGQLAEDWESYGNAENFEGDLREEKRPKQETGDAQPSQTLAAFGTFGTSVEFEMEVGKTNVEFDEPSDPADHAEKDADHAEKDTDHAEKDADPAAETERMDLNL